MVSMIFFTLTIITSWLTWKKFVCSFSENWISIQSLSPRVHSNKIQRSRNKLEIASRVYNFIYMLQQSIIDSRSKFPHFAQFWEYRRFLIKLLLRKIYKVNIISWLSLIHSISNVSASHILFRWKEDRLYSTWNRVISRWSPISIPILATRADEINYAHAVSSAPSFERKSRSGEEMQLPFLADASRRAYVYGAPSVYTQQHRLLVQRETGAGGEKRNQD